MVEHIRGDRLKFLDSIRGIAALTVVVWHVWLTVPQSEYEHANLVVSGPLSGWDLNSLFFVETGMAARSAVMLFFVLSGLVLAISLRRKHTPFVPYLIKRFSRIYPAMLITIVLSYALHYFIGAPHHLDSLWLDTGSNPDMSLKNLIECLLLWGTPHTKDLDGVIWSLVHEVRISIIFPLLLVLIEKLRIKGVALLGCMSSAASIFMMYHTGRFIRGFDEWSLTLSFFDQIYFAVFFAVGAYIALSTRAISSWLSARSQSFGLTAWLFVLICFLHPDSEGAASVFDDYAKGLGASALICMALGSSRLKQALDHKFPVWLGRISYSLYLVHCPIIYVIKQTFGYSWSAMETGCAVLPISLLIAELMARLVEFPLSDLGKRLASAFVLYMDNRKVRAAGV